MIFATGLAMSYFGFILARFFGSQSTSKKLNKADYIGVPAFIIGISLMAVSIGMAAARGLP